MLGPLLNLSFWSQVTTQGKDLKKKTTFPFSSGRSSQVLSSCKSSFPLSPFLFQYYCVTRADIRDYLRTHSQVTNQVTPINTLIVCLLVTSRRLSIYYHLHFHHFATKYLQQLTHAHTHKYTHLHTFDLVSLCDSAISSPTRFELGTCSNVLDMNGCVGNLLLLSVCWVFLDQLCCCSDLRLGCVSSP